MTASDFNKKEVGHCKWWIRLPYSSNSAFCIPGLSFTCHDVFFQLRQMKVLSFTETPFEATLDFDLGFLRFFDPQAE